MEISYPYRSEFAQELRNAKNGSLDLIVVITSALGPMGIDGLNAVLAECVRALKEGGLLFVHGQASLLPNLGVYLDRYLQFKYWVAIESTSQQSSKGLPSVHVGLLLFAKGNRRFDIQQVRIAHEFCRYCQNPLKDWGGKKHLMHPKGFVISDVWKYWPSENNHSQLSSSVLNTIFRMVYDEDSSIGPANFPFDAVSLNGGSADKLALIGPKEGIDRGYAVSETPFQYTLPGFDNPIEKYGEEDNDLGNRMIDVVHCGDALRILKRYPDNSVDLVFADPPYNLDKSYNTYNDGREDRHYIEWCNKWLAEYVRVLKPTGSLYILNLPKWAIHHAAFLSKHLYFQNWIVWDALSEPRGKLMPAHYSLLFYTKHPDNFTFNYAQHKEIDSRHYCLRASCIRRRKENQVDNKEPLTDLWWNIHRIKHKRDRDHHPCQLPEALMERIILLSTNPNDVVLDAFSGAGTTAVVSARLGRRYIAIDMDEKYARLTRKKIGEVERNGYVNRRPVHKPENLYTKKELQLELRSLAATLGRLPTPDDVRRMSKYKLQIFFELFPTWGKALKAAKLEVREQ
jgi:site-specific DNA-methyltransferase (adenine-specific)